MTATIQSSTIQDSGGANETSVILAAPSDIADDDLLLAIICADNNIVLTPPSGFTNVITQFAGGDPAIYVYRKDASSESGNYEFTLASAEKWIGYLARIDGHDTSTPVDVSAGASNSSGTNDAPSVTTTVDDCLVIYAAVYNGIRTPFSPPAGTTELFDENGAGAGSVSGTAASKVQATAGATGTGTFTPDSDQNNEMVTIAIAPESAAGLPIPVAMSNYRMRRVAA